MLACIGFSEFEEQKPIRTHVVNIIQALKMIKIEFFIRWALTFLERETKHYFDEFRV